ncbi:MAG: FHA domain-containing protein, partial [Ilumatobacteraceae bacterium]
TVVWFFGTEGHGVAPGSSTGSSLQILVLFAAVGILGLAAWSLRTTAPAELVPAGSLAPSAPSFVPAAPSAGKAFGAPAAPSAPTAYSVQEPAASAFTAAAWAATPVPSVDATVPRTSLQRGSMVKLRFGSGDVVVVTDALVLGRSPVAPAHLPGAAVQAVADPSLSISSTHCVVLASAGSAWVEDLGSTNGTDVVLPTGPVQLSRGQRVELVPGSRLQLGDNWCQLDE